MQRSTTPVLSRRGVMVAGTALGAAAMLGGRHGPVSSALAAGRTLTVADVGVGDPGGDWSKYTSSRAAPKVNLDLDRQCAVRRHQPATRGRRALELRRDQIVGGMQKPLVENDSYSSSTRSAAELGKGNATSSSTSARARRASTSSATRARCTACRPCSRATMFAYLPDKTGQLNFMWHCSIPG